MRQQGFELAQAGLDFARLAHVAGHGVERLQAVAGDAKNGGIIPRNFARRNEFLCHARRSLVSREAVSMARSRRLRFKLLETTAQGERKRIDGDLRSEKRFPHEIVAAAEG